VTSLVQVGDKVAGIVTKSQKEISDRFVCKHFRWHHFQQFPFARIILVVLIISADCRCRFDNPDVTLPNTVDRVKRMREMPE
jgi:hypothetical protein